MVVPFLDTKITIPYKANIVLKGSNARGAKGATGGGVIGGPGVGFSCHAEEAVLNKFLYNGFSRRSKLHIIVIRVNISGNVIYSKPCPDCCKKMRACGVKKVTYSDENGNLITKKLNNLGECKISSGYRNWNSYLAKVF